MPFYDYKCSQCGKVTEFDSRSDEHWCPSCHSPKMVRVWTPIGSIWNTDGNVGKVKPKVDKFKWDANKGGRVK